MKLRWPDSDPWMPKWWPAFVIGATVIAVVFAVVAVIQGD